MNSRGFNLFTALVSFLLITMVVLLVQSMIQSERRAADTLRAIEARSDIEAVADNAAADAVQLFNYKLRLKLARYISQSAGGTESYFTLPLGDAKWNDIVGGFVSTRFGNAPVLDPGDSICLADPEDPQCVPQNTQFAREVAGAMREFFYSTPSFGKYSITIENAPGVDETALNLIMRDLIVKTVNENKFFEVVGCSGDPWDCELGTFYVSLSVAELDATQYEQLPRVKVVNKATGDEIKQVILPRSNFKIYVPLRLFKALAEARGFAHYSDSAGQRIDSLIGSGNDQGMLSKAPVIGKNTIIDEMGLGLCDQTSCYPRTDPKEAPSETEINQTNYPNNPGCPGHSFNESAVDISLTPAGVCPDCSPADHYNANYGGGSGYKGTGIENADQALQNILTKNICEWAEEAYGYGYLGVDSGPTRVKNDFWLPEHNTNLTGKKCNNPLYSTPDYIEDITIQVAHVPTKKLTDTSSSPPTDQHAYCIEVREWSAMLAFTETNDHYLIERKPGAGGAWQNLTYRIKVQDLGVVNGVPRFTYKGNSMDVAGGLGECKTKRIPPTAYYGSEHTEDCWPA